MTIHRTTLLIAALATTATVVSACNSSTGSDTAGLATGSATSAAASADHDAADVTFASDMLSHHTQAMEMAGYAETRAADPRVKALAATIAGEQAPEITTMTGWLTMWGQPLPVNGGHDMSGMSGLSGAPGMMSDADMSALMESTGAAFDKMWLQMMTEHHTGALAMARTEAGKGRFGPAKALAGRITTSQTSQIATMKEILAML